MFAAAAAFNATKTAREQKVLPTFWGMSAIMSDNKLQIVANVQVNKTNPKLVINTNIIIMKMRHSSMS